MASISSSSNLSKQPGSSGKKRTRVKNRSGRYDPRGYGADNVNHAESLKLWVDTAVARNKEVFHTDGPIPRLPFKSAILRSPKTMLAAIQEYKIVEDEAVAQLLRVSPSFNLLLLYSQRHDLYNDNVTGCLPCRLCRSC